MSETNTYSALKPLTCNIRICLTIVLFPDSPAPGSREKREKSVKRCLEVDKTPYMAVTTTLWAGTRIKTKLSLVELV